MRPLTRYATHNVAEKEVAIYTVYKITENATGKAYIGVTTMSLNLRVYHHKQRKNPVGLMMLAAGDNGFTVERIGEYLRKADGLSSESEAIVHYGTHEPNGFNRRVRGGRYPGCGGPKEGNKNSRRRSVSAYENDGSLVATYPTVMDAAKALGLERGSIHRAIRQPSATAGRLHWRTNEEGTKL